MKQVEAHGEPSFTAGLSIKVSHLVKVMATMGFDPGELQRSRVGPESEEQVLVEGGEADSRGPGHLA